MTESDLQDVSGRIAERLAAPGWQPADLAAGEAQRPDARETTAAVAAFAIGLSGRKKSARRRGRFSRLIQHFALAAALAVSTAASACGSSSSGPNTSATAAAINQLPSVAAGEATISSPARGSPARFTDLVLLDPGTANSWALMIPQTTDAQSATPILVDARDAAFTTTGAVYRLAARAIPVGTRDGPSQFLLPEAPAEQTSPSFGGDATSFRTTVLQRWSIDERFAAPGRAIAGTPTVLDAAYNSAAAVAAGGTHTYRDGVVLRVDPDNPALQVIDRSLLESGRPTRAEDMVTVAIRPGERSLYDPGQVVTLTNVVMQRQQTDVNGKPTTLYVANAALQGARVDPTGKIDLQAALQGRLKKTDADLATQASILAAAPGTAAATPAATRTGNQSNQQTVIVEQGYRGPSYVDDFLIFMWLSHSGFYRGPSIFINNPPPFAGRPSGAYYYTPPGSAPSTGPVTGQSTSQSTAIQAARNSVSAQSSGTGGGNAATNKAAADSSAQVSAATAKSASVAGTVSTASAGKSISSAPVGTSAVAARSSGASSSTRSGVGTSGGSLGSGGSTGGFGSSGKGVTGGSSGGSSSGGSSSS